MADEESVEERFARETAGVTEPTAEPVVGEIVPPAAATEVEDGGLPLETFITDDFVGAIFALPGAMMARRTGHEFWQISEEEKNLLGLGAGPAVRALVRKYLSDSNGPMAAMGMVLGAVYAPKIMRESMERRRKPTPRPSPPPPPNYPQSAASPPSSGYEDAGSQESNFDSAEMPDE